MLNWLKHIICHTNKHKYFKTVLKYPALILIYTQTDILLAWQWLNSNYCVSNQVMLENPSAPWSLLILVWLCSSLSHCPSSFYVNYSLFSCFHPCCHCHRLGKKLCRWYISGVFSSCSFILLSIQHSWSSNRNEVMSNIFVFFHALLFFSESRNGINTV